MKTNSLLTLAALLATLASASLAIAATAPETDPASTMLQRHGSVAIASAGPYVAPGTFRVQVIAKLGRPDAQLADGTWLYHRRQIAESAARGILVIRFAHGRVQSLALATPATVAALQAAPLPSAAKNLVATQ